MAQSNFGIMELLQKLIKDRGTGVSDKEFGIMSGKQEGKGYQSFIDKNRFGDAEGSSYTPREMQTIDPLANTTPYGNATTPALTKMRDMQGDEPIWQEIVFYCIDYIRKKKLID